MNGPQYLFDSEGNATAVVLDLETYNRLIEAAEELQDIRDYVEAKRALEAGVETVRPVEEAYADYEARNRERIEQVEL